MCVCGCLYIFVHSLAELENLEEEAEKENERQQSLLRKRKRDEQFDKELSLYTARTEPLGKDRSFNKYWYFSDDPTRFYIERRGIQCNPGVSHTELKSEIANKDLTELSKLAKEKLIANTFSKTPQWMYYSTVDDVRELIASLDERGGMT